MISDRPTTLSKFFIAGINYKKTDASVRGKYAINKDQYTNLFTLAPVYGIKEFFVLSTCNRTEIYGFAEDAQTLCKLLCTQTEGDSESFFKMAYIRKGEEAIEHLFDVAAGLDSQILGDYEIIGQIKTAVKHSKEQGFIHSFTERLVNTVLQSSKNIKKETELSSGTVSVSFAAVQYIKEKIDNAAEKNILLLGTGKIGKNTCKNLVDYLGVKNITLINRTEEKAKELALEMGLQYATLNELDEKINNADIILVATNSADPVILKSHLEGSNNKMIIDLSIPYNVETDAQHLPNIILVNVDELSRIKDETLHMRQAEIPKAKLIICKYIDEFIEWYNMRRHVPVLKAIKSKLEEIQVSVFYNEQLLLTATTNIRKSREEKIQKVVNGMAVKMREQNQQGCYYIQAINEYIATGTN